MDIKQLGYFVKIAELGSFSRASRALQLSQPALSKQISNLELEFKERLLVRTGRGVETTEVGARMFVVARDLLLRVAQAHEEIESARRGKSCRIVIGMPPAVSGGLAVPISRRLFSELPDAQISIVHGRTSQLEQWIMEEQIDMAITFNTSASKLLKVDKLMDESLYLFLPEALAKPNRYATLNMLTELPMILGGRSNSVRMLLEAELSRLGQKPNIVLELDSFESSLELVREGFGCTVTSMEIFSLRDGNRDGLAIQKFALPELCLSIELVQQSRRPKNKFRDQAYSIVLDVSRKTLGGRPEDESSPRRVLSSTEDHEDQLPA